MMNNMTTTATRVTDLSQLVVGDTVRLDSEDFDYTVTALSQLTDWRTDSKTTRRVSLQADLSTAGRYRLLHRFYSEYDLAWGHLFKTTTEENLS